jgi:uncharacterized protein
MKYLLLFGLLALAWWVFKKRPPSVKKSSAKAPRTAEKMVPCAYCGVNLPVSDSIAEGEVFYCTEAHRLAAQAGERK